jgi:CBS domain-containing protein
VRLQTAFGQALRENIMPVGEICNRDVVIMRRDESVLEAAKLMRRHHVGDVVVVEERNTLRVPVGIVTDRDLVIEIMASEVERPVISVGDIMSPDFATVKESIGVFEAIQYMRGKGVRRLPVVSENGALVGILTLDDVLELLSEELLELAKVVRYEQRKEAGSRR